MKTGSFMLVILLAAALLLTPCHAFAAADDEQWLFGFAESFIEGDGAMGPWSYVSGDISVSATRCVTQKGVYYAVADLRLRNGTAFYSGGALGTLEGSGVELPNKISRRYDAVLGFTGDFAIHRGNPKGVMIKDGKVIYDRNDADVMAMMPDGSIKLYPMGTVRAEQLLEMGVKNAYSFGPILLTGGEFYEPAKKHMVAARNKRCSIGMIEPGHFIIIATMGGFTVQEMAELFKSYGCTEAYNMDGGHSASLVLMGEQLNPHPWFAMLQVYQRPLPDMVLVGKSELVPDVDAPVRYDNVKFAK